MSEQRTNSVRIGKYESESSFREAGFENFIQFISNIKTQGAIVGETDVVQGWFFLGFVGFGMGREGFVQKGSDVSMNQMEGEFVILEEVGQGLYFRMYVFPI